MALQLLSHPAQCFQSHLRRHVVGRDRHGEAINDDVLSRNSVAVRLLIDPAGDADPALRVGGNAVVIENKSHHNAAVLADQGEDILNALFFAVYRIDHGLSVVEAHAALESLGIGGVDLQGQCQHALELLYN